MTNFQTRLALTITNDDFELIEDLVYQGNEQVFRVPAGFKTDLASTPWFMKWLIPGISEKRDKAAVLHDWFYRARPEGVTRKDADRIFFRVMIEDGAHVWRALVMRWGVRAFGWMHWRKSGA